MYLGLVGRFVLRFVYTTRLFVAAITLAFAGVATIIIMALIELAGMPGRTIDADAFLTVVIVTMAAFTISGTHRWVRTTAIPHHDDPTD